MIDRRAAALAAVLATAALGGGCGEPATPTTPDPSDATSSSGSAPTGTGTPTPTMEPSGTASSAPSTTPSTSSGTPAEGGKCSSSADCAADEECIQGVPLNGKCWKKGTPYPRCLARGTRIDTPSGAVPVESLREGDLVWTLDHGARVAAPVARVGRADAPRTHVVRTIELADGRVLTASRTHPTCGAASAEPATVGDAAVGLSLDGAKIARATDAGYDGGETFDLLPTSDSGCYWAGGVLLGSTLAPVSTR